MSDPHMQSPVNPLPPVIVALFLALIGVEAIFTIGAQSGIGGPQAIGWRNNAIQTYGFNADIFDWMWDNHRYPAEHLMRFITYPFVSGSFTQALFGGVMVLALGKFVGDVFSQWATLLLFVVSSFVGAVVYGFVAGDQPWLLGPFPGVYGLIGGFTYLMWLKLGQMGAPQARAFSLIGLLLGIQLLFGLLFGGSRDWLADLSGFASGFTLSFVLAPGGWQKIRAMMRHE
ncbi:rhomboid family intramembrane serine protease [Roseovarius sp. EL26]|uniref:rhomboid family intramembrane serine protease n=1 Tax=Roseovarius sp. EL26 TaxID=2126672 RepID=UPI000EA10A5B|nr:rhomboid family intramembrane serine protease [Roseovarius sp. EL26]